jgi:hypothetical protein
MSEVIFLFWYVYNVFWPLSTQVDESDTGSDRILSDPTIRRNSIGIRVAKSLTNPMVES